MKQGVIQRIAIHAAGWLMAASAHAVSVQSVSPQGEVGQARQVTVKFSKAVVPLGTPSLPAPFVVACTGATVTGSGQWADSNVWVYNFEDDLPPGVRCTLKARPDWKPLGTPGGLTGTTEFAFQTGGPAVVSVEPRTWNRIDEDQYFLLTLNGPAVPASVTANAWCEVDGIGERLPVQLIGGPPRDAILKAQRVPADRAGRSLVVSCGRPLPSGAAIRLVWGKGIAAANQPSVVTSLEQRQSFAVRDAFTAEFTCERERSDAGCLPIRPMELRFSAPVDRQTAQKVRLKLASGKTLAPVSDPEDRATQVEVITFAPPLPDRTNFTIELPTGLKDDAGRTLANAASFPLKVATGDTPPIAKFSAAPFGVVELNADAMVPVTLRHVQPDLRSPAKASAPATPNTSPGGVRIKRLDTDADILAWYNRVASHHERYLTGQEAGLPESEWFTFEDDTDASRQTLRRKVTRIVGTRELSLLAKEPGVQRLTLPQLQGGDPRPFEVVGIPLPGPGYHVVEIESRRLGESLLNPKAPMYVRTGVLVTNLGVHFKLGRENSLVWVTTLDKGQPVAQADVAVNDCQGKRLWAGRTDAQGLARVPLALDRRMETCAEEYGFFVTARKPVAEGPAKGAIDTAFVFSNWQKGVESWRFNLPTSSDNVPDERAHTVFDRTLLRAGETVSMKHFLRAETSTGLAPLKADQLPTRVKLVHQGSGEEHEMPLTWQGQRSAVSQWAIPRSAKLGTYEVYLERNSTGDERQRSRWLSGSFRVEEFRIPLVDARLSGPAAVQVAPRELPLNVQLSYLSGGGMGQAPVQASALLRDRFVSFPGYDEFSFQPPQERKPSDAEDDEEQESSGDNGKLIADKLSLTTDRNGAARFTLKDLPPLRRPSDVLAEVTFNDPNGETQTVATEVALWPSAVVLGVKVGSWVSNKGQVKFTVLALDTAGKPMRGQRVDVRGQLSQVISNRKRMVGGFYAYDNRNEVKDLGALCSGNTDERGLLLCDATLSTAGEVELIAQAKDRAGNLAQAANTVWVTRQGELWFAQDNDDRMDVLPEKKHYEPGETARLQVRMPFREATALVSVEREGVVQTQVVTLRGDDPTVEVKIDKTWGPNVYVSVLALRGRLREVPWYSFFSWGWKEPVNWARSFWYEGREYQAPTAMVDLSKPAFKLGVASLTVGRGAHEMQVTVTADKPQYSVRQTARARIQVTQDGKPLPAGESVEVAFAAVDEGLLALRDNDSWKLLDGLIQQRAWGVETSTAQSEIIGRRHYGRKAVAAGGGGGQGATRELFDTLLVWKARVTLDAKGQAVVDVPLNDSLTSFRLVAVADAGMQKFGTGSTVIRVTQDLQVLPGLPPLVREGDQFSAMLTLRNTTARDMKVRATLAGTVASGSDNSAPRSSPLATSPQEVVIAAGSAKEVIWPIAVPADARSLTWEATADEVAAAAGSTPARDRVKVTQSVAPAVPVKVLQATLAQVDGPYSVPVAAPAEALPATGVKQGGLRVGVQPRLTGALPGLRRYFDTYPFVCLEQKTSKAVGLRDTAMWTTVANELPTYLDADGLASYFPPRAGDAASGSDRLTAYLLAATHEAGFALPAPARQKMLDGLSAYVEGRLERRFWAPAHAEGMDRDVRKLAAIEALSRHGRAQAKMLGSVNLTPTLWPTAAVIDWLNILRRVDGIPDRAKHLAQAQQILRSRLTYTGTTLKFSTEDSDFWWWLMDSADANAARLILAVMDDPAWKDDLPRMVVGSLGRQRNGAWLTTTANLWGSLALDKFSAKFESTPITGQTVASAGGPQLAVDWAKQPQGGTVTLPWPNQPSTLTVTQEGTGKPWLTVQSLAAVPLKAPLNAGYAITRTVTPVAQKDKAGWSRGDILRVRLEINAQADRTWVVVSDPVPGGATLLGSGLGRDSALATRGERSSDTAWAAFEERSFEAFRSYFEFMPKGRHVVEYTVRLNNPGRFALPPTRVEAMYAPESHGEVPNAVVEVKP